jgi:predicted ATPase
VFEQSWQMLSEQEQAVLRKIAVFWGGFRRDAAQEVVGATLAILTGLVDKSLLRSSTSGRYEVHELMRQYAGEKLAQLPAEQAATHQAHYRYYARFLQAHNSQNRNVNKQIELIKIDQEIDNIRAGWGWAIANRQEALIKQSFAGLFDFFWLRSRFQEGEERFAEAVEGLAQTDDKRLLAQLQLRQGAFHGVLGH